MCKVFVVSFVLVLALYGRTGSGHTYHSGECPSVEPMASFDMKQVSKFEKPFDLFFSFYICS